MNFDFSEEQKQLRATVRRFLDENCSSKVVRAALEGADKYDARLWNGLAELGLLGVAIPETYGGAGAGALELCVVAEELGRALAPLARSDKGVAGKPHQMLYYAPALRIAGGSDEIIRNIIAEQILGLPPEIRVDKDVPFREIPTRGR